MLFGEGPQIKNIAADLNKLFRQGSLLNQSVQTVEGDSTADQGASDLLAARDPVIQEISVGMSGEQSARYTVSGTPPLSLPNSLGKPLKAWSVDLLPYQEGTGDPAPDNVRPIHGTDKLNLFVEESYDPTATPKAVITLPQTVYTGTIGSEGGESRTETVILDGNTPSNVFSVTQLQDYTQVSYTPYISVGVAGNNFRCSTLKNGTIDGLYRIWGSSVPRLFMGLPTSVTNAADAVAWFADNPTQIEYPIATPTTIAVPSVTIPTPTGTATTWATAEDGTVESMGVTYVGKA